MDENKENLTDQQEEELFPVYCPLCGTWIVSLVPDCLPGLQGFTCSNGHRIQFPKGIQPKGTTEVMAG